MSLCAFDTRMANTNRGRIQMRRYQNQLNASSTAEWRDDRSVVLDWVTNTLTCDVAMEAGSGRCTPGACRRCPCDPVFNLDAPGGVSTYAMAICRRVVRDYGCAFKRGVVVGLGTGSISGCIEQQCPCLELETVDIDPAALSLARRYFGWKNSSAVSLVGAERYFAEMAAANAHVDLVIVDCFARHAIPEACRSAALLADIRRVLRPASPPSSQPSTLAAQPPPTLVAVNLLQPDRHREVTASFARALSGAGAAPPEQFGQWVLLRSGRAPLAKRRKRQGQGA